MNQVGVWSVSTGKCSQWLTGHTNAVRTVAVTDDGSKAVSAGTDGTMRVWDFATGKCVQTLGRHMGQTWALRCLPDCKSVVTGSMDKVRHEMNAAPHNLSITGYLPLCR